MRLASNRSHKQLKKVDHATKKDYCDKTASQSEKKNRILLEEKKYIDEGNMIKDKLRRH